ncbi:MAG: DUF1836 domain-containing protein [Clostridia bacterium]|nr:DUF1836 domain-containing protein [Clostridia bacterium]
MDCQAMPEGIQDFHMPRFRELPAIGLYLEQVTTLIGDALLPLGGDRVTSSMLSNYVKKKLVASPVKKQYSREQVAQLMFISVVKSVMTLEQIGTVLRMQQERFDNERAYDYFCNELETMLVHVFSAEHMPTAVKPDMP